MSGLNSGTTLNTRHLLPTSGYELQFCQAPWSESTRSGNCYSYALGDFRMDLSSKPQPGDVARKYDDLFSEYDLGKIPLWRDCVDIEKRILADGVAAWRLLGFSGKGSTVRKISMDGVPDPGYYKIVAVTDDVTGPPDTSTDYHFMRQDSYDMASIYTTPMYNHIGGRAFRTPLNPYEELGISAFVGGNKLERMGTGAIGRKPAYAAIVQPGRGGNLPPELSRSIVNTKIHVDRIPEYVIRDGNFLPDPFWIVGANPFNPDARAIVSKRAEALLRYFSGSELHRLTVEQAAKDCLHIVANPKAMPKKHMLIGLWSHKLGWASGPINTDGDGKLILDPRKARKQHGDLDYRNVCSSFQVMRGEGLASNVSM